MLSYGTSNAIRYFFIDTNINKKAHPSRWALFKYQLYYFFTKVVGDLLENAFIP